MGIATRVAVRLMPNPPAVATMLCAFDSIDAAAAAVTGTIAGGVLPAALEMMDARITAAVEDFVGAGYPRDAEAVLLVEVDGMAGGVGTQVDAVREIANGHGAVSVRVAADDAERALLWKGRKSAFGAIARIAPDYYLHDAVVPRTRLVDVLRGVYDIADAHQLVTMNVFHAGDGNLHPLIVFDRREPGVWDRVYAAGNEILTMCIEAGGVLTGEHGVGVEKRDLMPLMFSRRRSRRAGPPARRVRSRRRGQPDEGAAARQPVRRAATRSGGCVDLIAGDRGARARRSRPPRPSCPSARARSGRSATRLATPPRSARPRASPRTSPTTSRSPSARERRAPTSTSALGRARPGVPARSPRCTRRRSAASWRAACRASVVCGTARCATRCSRSATSTATAGS